MTMLHLYATPMCPSAADWTMRSLRSWCRWSKFAAENRDRVHAARAMDWAVESRPDSNPTAPPTDQWVFDGICRVLDFLGSLVHWAWVAAVPGHGVLDLYLHWAPFHRMDLRLTQCRYPRSPMQPLVVLCRFDWVHRDCRDASHAVYHALNHASDVCVCDCPNRPPNMPANWTSTHCHNRQLPLHCLTHSDPFDR